MSVVTAIQRRLMNVAFDILYHQGAPFYDLYTRLVFVGEWRRWQESALPFLPQGGIVVEIGSGTFEFGASSSTKFRRWIGVEESKEMIGVSRNRLTQSNQSLIRGSAFNIPLRAQTADAVLATFPSRYVLDSRFLREAQRVMKRDGRLVLVLTGDLDPIGVRRTAVRRLMRLSGTAPNRAQPPEFTLDGFDGRAQWRMTEYGAALIYVGTPCNRSTSLAGCNPPRGGAAVLATARRHRSMRRSSAIPPDLAQ
jgi:SAM-dependent methyltransferase